MLSELHSAHKVIGVKQTKKAIKDGQSRHGLCCARRGKTRHGSDLRAVHRESYSDGRNHDHAELGDAVGIDVGASVVSVLAE